ncbi:hypothetical protein F4679DRAFT_574700 [Xylaria curta]|nr:hypothetical protein F4679DRAFT_574700 [Xylaria curta]
MSTDDPDISQLEGASLFIVLCTLFLTLRFISLRIGRRPIGLEDWLIVPAWVVQLGLCANAISYKTTILLLYLRLFRIHRWFRITTHLLITYIWLWGISEVIVALSQCIPIAYQWDKTLGDYRWVSVPNVIHDAAMLILPLPMVWSLQIDLRQKLALSGVFLIDSMQVFDLFSQTSFVRLSILFELNAFSDNTWASVLL